MSGVWIFKNGATNIPAVPDNQPRKVPVHMPTDEVVTSYEQLQRMLPQLEWERYYDDPALLQFHNKSSVNLISLPLDFSHFKSMHMYGIIVKNRENFAVRDI